MRNKRSNLGKLLVDSRNRCYIGTVVNKKLYGWLNSLELLNVFVTKWPRTLICLNCTLECFKNSATKITSKIATCWVTLKISTDVGVGTLVFLLALDFRNQGSNPAIPSYCKWHINKRIKVQRLNNFLNEINLNARIKRVIEHSSKWSSESFKFPYQ